MRGKLWQTTIPESGPVWVTDEIYERLTHKQHCSFYRAMLRRAR